MQPNTKEFRGALQGMLYAQYIEAFTTQSVDTGKSHIMIGVLAEDWHALCEDLQNLRMLCIHRHGDQKQRCNIKYVLLDPADFTDYIQDNGDFILHINTTSQVNKWMEQHSTGQTLAVVISKQDTQLVVLDTSSSDIKVLSSLVQNSILGSCDSCHSVEAVTAMCSRCKQTSYCSNACQRKHWKNGHKAVCKAM